jgi:NADH-quinone oxidoreductase subunit N
MLPTVCVLIQTVILVFLFCFADGSNVGITAFNGSLHQKLDSEFFEAFTGLLVAVSLVFAVYYSNKKRIHQYEYVLIFLISFLALVIICPVFDFMSFFLGIELQSLAFYVLATFF